MYAIINNVQLKIKEYKGQRAVTFKDIDMAHGRPEGTAHRNFKANRDYFIEEEDYFKVCADEIRLHKIMDISPKTHGDIILITESGYLMIVKSLTDKLSWSVQRELVKTYFRSREMLTYYNDALVKILANQEEMKKRQNDFEEYIRREISYIRNDILAVRHDANIINDNTEKNIQTAVEAATSETVKVLAPFMNTSGSISAKNKIRRQPRNYSRGKIENLPPAIKSQVDGMIISGKYSCQKISDFITGITGESISYMTVSRYIKSILKINNIFLSDFVIIFTRI